MDKITFVKGDICDFDFVLDLFKKYDINGVIHFAAESHVDNSIKIHLYLHIHKCNRNTYFIRSS